MELDWTTDWIEECTYYKVIRVIKLKHSKRLSPPLSVGRSPSILCPRKTSQLESVNVFIDRSTHSLTHSVDCLDDDRDLGIHANIL